MVGVYTCVVAILALLAVSGLYVGVTNDAVNFLNSAIGSKAAKMRTILIVASIGIVIGAMTSSGMMEVARSGMFDPSLFTFHEVMMLYLGVMFANTILLDLYNTWGLPTSTTVSLIFCLLGSAIAVSIFKIAGTDTLAFTDLGSFINTDRAMGIIAAILLSVVLAFTCGMIVMYISRLLFTFRYHKIFRNWGALWCGVSLASIVYFAVFKGLKAPLAGTAFINYVNEKSATVNMTEKFVTETHTVARAFNKTGDIRHNEGASLTQRNNTENGCEGCEMIVCNDGLCLAYNGNER